MSKEKTFKFAPPKKPGLAPDMLYALREQKAALRRQMDDLDERETALENWLVETLPKGEASGISGKVARCAVVTKVVPKVEDWDKLYAHVLKTKDFSLLARSLGKAAVKERWDAKKKVPGVGEFAVVSVSLSKL